MPTIHNVELPERMIGPFVAQLVPGSWLQLTIAKLVMVQCLPQVQRSSTTRHSVRLRDRSLSVMSSRSQEGWQQITAKPRAEDKKPRQKKPEAVSVPATAGNSNRSIFAELDRCGILQSPPKPESRRNAVHNP